MKPYPACDFGGRLEVLNVPVMMQQHSDMDVRMSPKEPGWLIQDGCVMVILFKSGTFRNSYLSAV